MFLLWLKKSFFDMWDNLVSIILLNIVFVISILMSAYLLTMYNKMLNILFYILLLFGLFVINLIAGIIAMFSFDYTNYKKTVFSSVLSKIKQIYKASFFFTLVIIFYFFTVFKGIPFYLASTSSFAFYYALFLLWFSLFFILAIQFYYPIFISIEKRPIKVIKKCFIIFYDNLLFSFISIIGVLIILILSFFTAFFLFGISTVMIWLNNGIKLRLYKYDYLRNNFESGHKKIPWDLLMESEKKLLGNRSLSGIFMPWKD